MSETRTTSKYRLHTLLGVMFILAGLVAFQPDASKGIILETMPTHQAPQALSMALPASLTRAALPPALHDPFVSAAPPVIVAKSVEPPPPPPPAPPPVVVPPLNLQFIGRVIQSDGKVSVYMAYGDNTLAITEGQSLPNGYKVNAVTQRSVRFSHPQLENPVLLELPAPPAFQIR